MPRTFILALCTVLAGCGDRITAPEAEAVLAAVDQSLADPGPRYLLWERLGWPDGLGRLRTASRVRAWKDGGELTYNGVVFERVMVPTSGSGRSECLGTRWSLVLWGDGERPEGMTLNGGRFDEALSRGQLCSDIGFSDPAPVAVWHPPEPGPEQLAWVSVNGRAEITPGVDVGPCGFLSPADAEAMYRSRGITCRVTRHRVFLEATLHPNLEAGQGSRALGPMRIDLPRASVLGVRYTIECGLPQAAELCLYDRRSQP